MSEIEQFIKAIGMVATVQAAHYLKLLEEGVSEESASNIVGKQYGELLGQTISAASVRQHD